MRGDHVDAAALSLIVYSGQVKLNNCPIPDDCLDPKRYPLFMGRAVMQELVNSLKTKTQLPLVKGSPA